jgi:putative peptide zinc metalloprotease protein
MVSTSQTLKPSTEPRTFPVRMRSDLLCVQQRYQGGDYWLVKDPLTLQYFRFQEQEYWLLSRLDGRASLEQIQREFQERFAPQRISTAEIHQFVGMLFRSGMVLSDTTEQGHQLWQRRQRLDRQERWGQVLQLLSYRFPGFDPSSILDRLLPWTAWCFSVPALVVAFLLAAAATTLGLTQFEEIQQRLPSFQQFFAMQNWAMLAVILALTKVLHELGHGLACRRFGGECHEMGVMLLVLTPCLYCNVSDAWMIPSKWKRIFISAAGMYVELVLASLAMFVWYLTQPGLLNSIALNMVFVCGVSTLLFNLNPLLRFDGYYILADWLEIPNLRQKATQWVQRLASRWMLGLPVPRDPFLPQRFGVWFATYSVASFCYRWLLTFTIFWFLYHLLEPYGLKVVGQALAAFSVIGLVIYPLVQLKRFFKTPGKLEAVRPMRVMTTSVLVTAAIAGVLFLPIPHFVDMPVSIQPAEMTSVYVEVPGILEEVQVEKFANVQPGQPLVRLVNHELRQEVLLAEHELQQSERKLQDVLHRQVSGDSQAGLAIETAKVQIQNARLHVEDCRRRLEALQIVAPIGGWLIPPPRRESPPTDAERLPSLVGDPLEPANRHCVLPEQTLVAHVAPDMERWEAQILVDQEEVEFLAAGQDVRLWLQHTPWQVIRTSVTEVAVDPSHDIPPPLASLRGGPIEVTSDAGGRFKATQAKYLVVAHWQDNTGALAKDLTGVARIHVGYRTVGYRLARFFAYSFNFHW